MSDIGKTLHQFISEELREHPVAGSDVLGLLNDIISACKKISHLVGRSNIDDLGGYADSENVQGETQKKLDILTNEIMIESLKWSGHLAAMISEEVEDIIQIPTKYPKGDLLVCFDPLDGSSNIDVNMTVGTIFSILLAPNQSKTPTLKDFLQKGTQQLCAGFTLYGPATMLIITLGHGVNAFTLDNTIGEFVLTHPNMRIPKETQEFAINISNQRFWEPPVQKYVAECIEGTEGVRKKNFNMRWNASMVAEVYRILIRGGIFMYPIDSKIAHQGGKLRLMYEANPMSFIVEQAGGTSSTGIHRILDILPESTHQRVPVILGSQNEVERLIRYHQDQHTT